MNKKQIACGSCKRCFDKPLIHKDKDGKNYCFGCKARFLGVPPDQRPLNREDFDKLLRSLWLTPPLSLKDLKAQLKKEREKKKRKAKSKKTSK